MTAGIDWTEPDVPLSRLPARDLPHWTDCPGAEHEAAPPSCEREGLWVVVYRDDGSMTVVDCPLPATMPVQ